MKKLFTIVLSGAIMLSMVSCGETSTNTVNDTTQTQNSTTENTKNQLSNKGTIDGKYDVEIVSAKKGTDYEGKPCVIVTYNFTNNSDSNASFIASTTTKAFQNKVQCETAIVVDGSMDSQPSMSEVQPGGSITAEMAYSLQDETNIVTIQVSPLISFTNEISAEMKYNPAE